MFSIFYQVKYNPNKLISDTEEREETMALFSKVIKYEGDNKTFVWKHPATDFTTGSQLIVHESQEAIFIADGKVLDTFGAGRHTLETANLPLVSSLMRLATGGKRPFHCELYFVNKTEQMAIPWGTDSKIKYLDPVYNFPVEIGACGEMNLQIENSGKLVIKVVGTEKSLTQQQLVQKLRAFIMKYVKAQMSRYISDNKLNVFDLDQHLAEFSACIQDVLEDEFVDYGVKLAKFSVMTIVLPDDEPSFIKFRQLHYRRINDVTEAQLNQQIDLINQETQARKTVMQAEAMAKKRALEGYTYQQERGFDIAGVMAENEATGQFNNLGIGLGLMAGIGGTLGREVGGMATSAMHAASEPAQPKRFCIRCGSPLSPTAMFCEKCGAKVEAETETTDKCLGCGHIFSNDAMFCPKCGRKRGE